MNARDHSQLAGQVQRVRGALSYNQLATRTGMNSALIYKMATGGSVTSATLHKWATAIGEDPDDWYIWGGYPEMARKPAATDHSSPNTGVTKSPGQPGHPTSEEAVREPRLPYGRVFMTGKLKAARLGIDVDAEPPAAPTEA